MPSDASADDAAAYILERQGAMTKHKLNRLLYYAQAWHLAWEDEPLFEDRIEAWAGGPVVPRIWDAADSFAPVGPSWTGGDAGRLDGEAHETLDAVLDSYGPVEGRHLAKLALSEGPSREARRGLDTFDRGHRRPVDSAEVRPDDPN